MNKYSKTVLEMYLKTDRILFGENGLSRLSEDEKANYITTKAALITNVVEMYIQHGFVPKSEFKTGKELNKRISENVKELETYAANIIKENKDAIRKEIQENTSNERDALLELSSKYKEIALDAMFMKEFVGKHKNPSDKLRLSAYYTLRDNIIGMSRK